MADRIIRDAAAYIGYRIIEAGQTLGANDECFDDFADRCIAKRDRILRQLDESKVLEKCADGKLNDFAVRLIETLKTLDSGNFVILDAIGQDNINRYRYAIKSINTAMEGERRYSVTKMRGEKKVVVRREK